MGTQAQNARKRLFVIVGLAAILAIILLTIALGIWLEREANVLSENGVADGLGDAGEYLNLKYGVPVAFLGAVVGLFIAAVGYLFTSQQNEIEILRFVEEKTLKANEKYLALRSVLERFMITGNGIRAAIYKRMQVQTDAKATDEEKAQAQAEYDAAVEGLVNSFKQVVTSSSGADQDEAPPSLTQVAAQIQSDSYTAYFVREQKESSKGPLAFLRQHLPADHLEGLKSQTSSDLYDVVRCISLFASSMTKADIMNGYLLTPYNTSTVDLLGAAMAMPGIAAEADTKDRDGRTIVGYRINLGAAYILEIVDLLPDCESIVSAFNNIFGHRSEVASKFLKEAGPDRQRLASRYWLESFEPQFDNFNRLIVVYLKDVPNEFYDPERHGALKFRPAAHAVRSR